VQYTVRKVALGDFFGLLEVEQEAFLGDGYSPYFIKMIPHLYPDTCFVAEAEGHIIAYSLGARDGHDREVGWILTAAVKRGYQGHGIGTAVATALVDAMGQQQIKRLILTVEPSNPARELYRRHGFVETKFEEDCYGLGKARYYMERRLAP